MSQQLYFLALIPPPEIEAEVNHFKSIASQKFGSSHALKSPAHITLIPPFWWQEARLEHIVVVLQQQLIRSKQFEIELNGFACFKPRVIYIDVMPNSDLSRQHLLLKELFKRQWSLEPERRTHYRPHMTVAFKDLSKSSFFRAWDYFRSQDYRRRFTVDSIYILVHLYGRWSVRSQIPLEKN